MKSSYEILNKCFQAAVKKPDAYEHPVSELRFKNDYFLAAFFVVLLAAFLGAGAGSADRALTL
jgi:hypothetical protein